MRAYRPLFLFIRLAALCMAVCALISVSSCAPVSTERPVTERSEYTGKIFFENRRYTFEGDSDCIAVENDALVIKKEGTYLLWGRLSEGRIITDAPFVRLVLGNAEICSSVSSPIESRRGALALTSTEGSVNIIRFDPVTSGARKGAIHTDGDLFIEGKGKTAVTARGEYTSAIACKRFFADSGELTLTAERGINTLDGRITGGRLTLSGGKTGIYAENLIEMTGGALVAVCEETVLFAENRLILTGGEREVRAKNPYVCKKDEKKDEKIDK